MKINSYVCGHSRKNLSQSHTLCSCVFLPNCDLGERSCNVAVSKELSGHKKFHIVTQEKEPTSSECVQLDSVTSLCLRMALPLI